MSSGTKRNANKQKNEPRINLTAQPPENSGNRFIQHKNTMEVFVKHNNVEVITKVVKSRLKLFKRSIRT